MLSRPLTPPELNTWKEQHHLHLKQPFTADQVAQIVDWTNRVELWAEEPGKWMKYFEGENRQLCRVENFIEFHAGFNELICGQPTLSMVAELMGEPAVLFKEKINFKPSDLSRGALGVGGWRPPNPEALHGGARPRVWAARALKTNFQCVGP